MFQALDKIRLSAAQLVYSIWTNSSVVKAADLLLPGHREEEKSRHLCPFMLEITFVRAVIFLPASQPLWPRPKQMTVCVCVCVAGLLQANACLKYCRHKLMDYLSKN